MLDWMPRTKRLMCVLPSLLLGVLLLAGCGGDEREEPSPTPAPQITIVVTGTKGLRFDGEWKVRGPAEHSDTELRDHRLPDTPPRSLVYDANGTITYLRFEKRQEEGLLRVIIREEIGGDSRVIVRLETTEPFGVLNLGPQ